MKLTYCSLSSVLVVSLCVSPVIVAWHFSVFGGFVWNLSYTIVFNNYKCILMFLLPTATVCLFRLVLETSYIVLGETFSNCSAYIIRIDSNVFNWITLVYDTRRCITIFVIAVLAQLVAVRTWNLAGPSSNRTSFDIFFLLVTFWSFCLWMAPAFSGFSLSVFRVLRGLATYW